MKRYTLLFLTFIIGLSANAQSVKWLKSDGGSSSAEIRNLAVDPSGFIYAVGSFNTNMVVNGNTVITRGGYDGFIAKYTAAGNLIWLKTIGGTGTDIGLEIETDGQHKVYVSVVALSSPIHVADSILPSSVSGILRFDSTGKFETVLTTGMSIHNMKVYQNSIYIRNALNVLYKFDLNGSTIWSKSISGSFASNNLLPAPPETSLEITQHGDIIFSQSCTGNYTYDGVTVSNSSGRFLVASLIDTNSNLIRNYTWGMNQGFELRSRSAIVDQDHNVYLAASFPEAYSSSFGSSTIQHLLSGFSFHSLLKFDPLGNPVWAFNISCANSTAYFYDLALDNTGNVALLGMYNDITSLGSFNFPVNSFNGNIFTATISPGGMLLTAMGFGSNNGTDRARDIQLLNNGTFVMGGMTFNAQPVQYGCINSVTAGFMVMNYSYDPPVLPDVSFSFLREQREVYFSSAISGATNISWDFGDGTTSAQRNPPHIFNTPGNFTVRLIGSNSCGSDTFSTNILYKGIQKVVPERIANNKLQIVVAKGGFPFSSAQMILKQGAHTILSETVAVNDSGIVQGNFRLQNEPLGMYDLIVQSGAYTDTLYNGLEMEPENNDSLTIQVSGPALRLVNRFQRYEVTVHNPANVNRYAIPVLIAIHPQNEIARLSNFVIADSISNVVRDSAFVHDFIMVHDSATGDSMWVAMLVLPVIAPKSTETIEFYMRGTSLGNKLMIAALLNPAFNASQLEELGVSRTSTSCDFLGDAPACVLDILNQVPGIGCLTSAFSLGCSIGNIARDIAGNRNRQGDGKKYIADVFNFLSDVAGVLTCEAGGFAKDKAEKVAEDVVMKVMGEVLGISSSLLTGNAFNIPMQPAGLPFNIPGSCLSIFLKPKKNLKDYFISDVSSMDPNDKTGPAGINTGNYFDGKAEMQYTIRFENVDTATAPASVVEITDTLDASFFDISSLRFTGFGFADSSYQVLNAPGSYVQEIDLRPSKNTIVRFMANIDTAVNVVTWKFESLDPVSRDLVVNPFDGFLNPNQSSPEGEGYVSFSIKPLPDRPHLQQVNNDAKIVFDENAPIFTDVWSNIVDKQKPSSHILPLPPVILDTIFTVKWTGTDPHSGIQAYDIYVIRNNTDTVLQLRNTRADSVRLKGTVGSNYKFYSIATDHAGNIEDAPDVPDTEVSLSWPLPLQLLTFSGTKLDSEVLLKWETTGETNTSHFEVQRSNDGLNFQQIGRVNATGNAGTQHYSLLDLQPASGNNFYRLKMMDVDGRFSYSGIIRINMENIGLMTVFPNPVKNMITVAGLKQGGVLKLIGMDGKLMLQWPVTAQSMTVDISRFAKGIYLLQYLKEEVTTIQRIIKQ